MINPLTQISTSIPARLSVQGKTSKLPEAKKQVKKTPEVARPEVAKPEEEKPAARRKRNHHNRGGRKSKPGTGQEKN